jgi:hypothetical protein
MDFNTTVYSHKGKQYVSDSYYGTMRADVYDARFGWNGAPHITVEPKKVPRKPTAFQVKQTQTIAELKARAEELSEKLVGIDWDDIDEWKVKKGYMWRVTSPSGKVYTEVIKPITIAEPDDYVAYHAMRRFCMKKRMAFYARIAQQAE